MRFWIRPTLLSLAMLCIGALGASEFDAPFTADQPLLAKALTPAGVRELATVHDLPLYHVRARLDTEGRAITGSLRLWVVNRTPDPWPTLAFHAFANAESYHGASMGVTAARVDGVAQRVEPSSDGTSISITLPAPLAPHGRACIELEYQATMSSEGGLYGLNAAEDGVECLYNWYPDLAVWRDGAWQLHPVGDHGDPTQSESAHVIAEVVIPDAWSLVSSGIEVERRAEGATVHLTIASPFTRNLAMVAAKGLRPTTVQVGDTRISSWCFADDANAGGVARDVAADALALFSERFGAYPYSELDIVEVRLGSSVGGMESTGLVLISGDAYAALRNDDGQHDSMPLFMMNEVVAHEIAHQWWYGMVGSDAWLHPWLDESLTNWSGCYYLEQRKSAILGAGGFNTCLLECATASAGPIAAPLTSDADAYDMVRYEGVIYGRGALMYQALRRQIGDDAFLGFLRSWLAEHRFGYVQDADWLESLRAAVGMDAAATFARKWLNGEGLTKKDLMSAARPIQALPRKKPEPDKLPAAPAP